MPGVHVHIIPIATIGAVLPVNYAAGDLTVTSRLFVGNVALQTEARFAQVYDSYTPATPSVNNSLFVLVNASPPAGAAADELRAIKAELNVRPTAAYAGSGTGFYAEADHDSGAFNVAALTGGFFQGIQEVAATTATVVYGGRAAYRAILGTIDTAIGLDIIKGNAADAGAITTAIGLRILASAGVVPTTDIGMQVLGNVQSRIVGPLTLGADAAPTAGFNLDIQAGNLRLVNSQVTGVYLRVGSTTAPTNVTAGDFTAVRISLGNAGALGGAGLGHTIDVQNTMTDTTAGAKAFSMLRPVITPASNSSSEFRSLYFQMIVNPATTITLSQIRSGWFETRFRQDGAVSEAVGVVVQPVTVDSGSVATVGTITTAEGIRMNLYARPSGTSVLTVTTMLGLNFPAARLGTGISMTTLEDILVTNPTAPTALVNHFGIDIQQLTRASAINVGLRNASPTVFTPSTVQTLAAGTAILANATFVMINSTGDVTSTAAPTVADGQDGQRLLIMNVDTTDTITLQDQGTLANSNLRLSANTIVLGPRDSIELMYSATVGDWVQVGQRDVL